jgi:hypothetical protein
MQLGIVPILTRLTIPCFAGERATVHVRLFQLGSEIGAAGTLVAMCA